MSEVSFQSLMQEMGVDTTQQVVLPDEGGRVGGFIAPIWCGHLMVVSTDVNLAQYNNMVGDEKAIAPTAMSIPRGEEWTWHYWYATQEGRDAAEAAHKALQTNVGPQLTFFAGLKASEAVNISDEALARFKSDDINAEAKVRTWQSKKYRHEYQLIVLPTMVRAVAECYREELGISPDVNLEFDTSELQNLGVSVTDDFFQNLCGNPDDKDGYLESVLFQRREKLWAALGESDGTKFKPTGSGKFGTDSPVLSNIFSFITSVWTKPQWGRFTWLYDPRPDAVSRGGEYRNQLPGIVKLYKTELDARADAGSGADGEVIGSDVIAKQIPAAWADMEADFREELATVLKSVTGKPRKIQVRKVASELDITSEEAEVWVP